MHGAALSVILPRRVRDVDLWGLYSEDGEHGLVLPFLVRRSGNNLSLSVINVV